MGSVLGPPGWLVCPNEPPCPHPGLLHDINDYDDPRPTCCAEGCRCGQPTGEPMLRTMCGGCGHSTLETVLDLGETRMVAS